jgi:uncharacterized protein (UPF0332 family)
VLLRIARLSLQNHDPDSAVNRAYYAMFNISRAALLSSGVAEGELPRTHRGVSEAFREHAVLTNRIDSELASSLGRAESLRLMADYTAKQIDRDAGIQVVARAETYVLTVERAFDLAHSHEPETSGSEQQRPRAKDIDEIRERAAEEWARMREAPEGSSPSLDEVRAKARESWLQLRRQESAQLSDPAAKAPRKDLSRDFDRNDATNETGRATDKDLEP